MRCFCSQFDSNLSTVHTENEENLSTPPHTNSPFIAAAKVPVLVPVQYHGKCRATSHGLGCFSCVVQRKPTTTGACHWQCFCTRMGVAIVLQQLDIRPPTCLVHGLSRTNLYLYLMERSRNGLLFHERHVLGGNALGGSKLAEWLPSVVSIVYTSRLTAVVTVVTVVFSYCSSYDRSWYVKPW